MTPKSPHKVAPSKWLLCTAMAICLAALGHGQSTQKLRAEFVPPWSAVPAARTIDLDFNTGLTDEANGERLRMAVLSLVAGDHLRVSSGRWSVANFFYAHLRGTPSAPIRITGAPGAVITRPNAGQNIFNIGGDAAAPTTCALIRGFEFEGGSYGLRVHWAEDLWIDQCHVHHTAAVAIGANTHNTKRLFVTRCEIHHTGGTGEGIYLGANGGTITAQDAVVAMNHIHHTFGTQGDGIEVKQGSHGCLIAENTIHDTQYPGILCYGTGGRGLNRIENNTIWNTASNPFQVQGEAIVRGNLVFARNGPALQSAPHQGSPTRLAIRGNTFIAENGRAATLSSWAGEPGMVLRSNVFYARNDVSVAVNGGLSGVDVGDNVVLGPLFGVPGGAGFAQGVGLSDMVDVAWDGSKRDARPLPTGALFQVATPQPQALALTGALRGPNPSVGALEPGTYGRYLGAAVPGAPRIRLRAPLAIGTDATFEVLGFAPGDQVELAIRLGPRPGPGTGGFPSRMDSAVRRIGVAGSGGLLRLVVPSSMLSGASGVTSLRARKIHGPQRGPWSRSMSIRL